MAATTEGQLAGHIVVPERQTSHAVEQHIPPAIKKAEQNHAMTTSFNSCCETMRRAIRVNVIRIDDAVDLSDFRTDLIRIKRYFLQSVGEIRFCPWCGMGVRQ